MLSNDELKAMRERAKIQTRDSLPTALAKDVNDLLAELERVRKIHREEQRRSADRLREALTEGSLDEAELRDRIQTMYEEELRVLREALQQIVQELPHNDDSYDGTANPVIGPIARNALAGTEL